jgi:hypothetical protein
LFSSALVFLLCMRLENIGRVSVAWLAAAAAAAVRLVMMNAEALPGKQFPVSMKNQEIQAAVIRRVLQLARPVWDQTAILVAEVMILARMIIVATMVIIVAVVVTVVMTVVTVTDGGDCSGVGYCGGGCDCSGC